MTKMQDKTFQTLSRKYLSKSGTGGTMHKPGMPNNVESMLFGTFARINITVDLQRTSIS